MGNAVRSTDTDVTDTSLLDLTVDVDGHEFAQRASCGDNSWADCRKAVPHVQAVDSPMRRDLHQPALLNT